MNRRAEMAAWTDLGQLLSSSTIEQHRQPSEAAKSSEMILRDRMVLHHPQHMTGLWQHNPQSQASAHLCFRHRGSSSPSGFYSLFHMSASLQWQYPNCTFFWSGLCLSVGVRCLDAFEDLGPKSYLYVCVSTRTETENFASSGVDKGYKIISARTEKGQ